MSGTAKTPVSYLFEYCARKGIVPKYDFVAREGASHKPTFKFRVRVEEITATGTGQSKKKAKHSAARSVMEILLAKQDNMHDSIPESSDRVKANQIVAAPLAERATNSFGSATRGPTSTTLNSGAASAEKPQAMLEKLNGKSGSAATDGGGGAKSLSTPPFTAKSSAKNNHMTATKGMKRKSRSPSPSVATESTFGPTETLQRERLKRLRKEKASQAGAENGCASGRANGDKGSARKSVNPRRVSVSKVELAAVVDRTKVKDGGKASGDGLKNASSDLKKVGSDLKNACDDPKVEKKLMNGALTPSGNVAAAVQKPQDAAVKVKIDFVMEESDEEDEEENEGLKKLMENIDQELSAAPDSSKALELEDKEDSEKKEVEKEKEPRERRVKRPAADRIRVGDTNDKTKRPRCSKVEQRAKAVKKEKVDEGADDDAEVVCVEDSLKVAEDCAEDASQKKLVEKADAGTSKKPVDEVIDLESSVEADKDSSQDANATVDAAVTTSCTRTEENDKDEKESTKREPVAEETMAESQGSDERTAEKEPKKNKMEDAVKADEELSAEDKTQVVSDSQSARSNEPEKADRTPDTVPEKSSIEVETQETECVKQETKVEIKENKDDLLTAEPMEEEGTSSKGPQAGDEADTCVLKTEKIMDEKQMNTTKRKGDTNNDIGMVNADAKGEPEEMVKPQIESWRTEAAVGCSGREKVYRLTKSELENLVYNKVTEFFTDANKSELGALRTRCEQLEKCLEQWRRKAQFYQKQMADMQNLVQRARRFAMPLRPSMRSVGLQVQLTRYIPADPSKLVSRVAQMGVPVSVSQPTCMLPGQKKVLVPKQVSTSQLTFVTNLGPQGTLAGATMVNKNGMPQMSNVGTTATVNTMLTARPQTSTFSVPTRTATNHGQLQGGQMGVSLLHPRTTAMPGSYIIGSAQNVTNALGAALVKTPGATPLLRTTLDPTKVSSAVGTPVPTCLVQNQALNNGQTTAVTMTAQAATTRPVSVSLIGQPTVVTSAVKLIDLTADEEDAAAKAAQQAVLAAAASSTTSLPMTMMPATLCAGTGNNTMTVLTPASNGQLLALGSAIVSGTGTLGSATPIRVTAPIRGAGNSIVNNNGSVRLTYLMPTSSVMTMVRPNQPVFVTPSAGMRPGTTGVGPRQGLPTIVLQRGTTLVPLQQGQVTTIPAVRPGSIISSPSRTISTAAGPITLVGAPTVNRTITTLTTTPTGVTSYTLTSTAANAMLNVPVAKTVTTPAPTHVIKHPAPLPIQPKYPEMLPSVGRRPIPPKPTLKISKVPNGIVLSWNMCLNPPPADITSFQLYAYQEGTAPPSTSLWKKVGDVKALPLPMACTLTQFMEGHKYHFAVRAMDAFNRLGPFSDPGCIALVSAAPSTTPVGKPMPIPVKTNGSSEDSYQAGGDDYISNAGSH